MIVDLFAGPGGWSEGLRMLGLADVGIEWDAAACATRAAAGHLTVRADVVAYPCAPFRGLVEGLIASPPCQDFSMAGKRAGRMGEKGQLIDDVPRWVDELRPRWVALEQVPPALPVWQEFVHLFRSWGYAAWTGVLNAADYGVPQTRARAILIARRDGRPALPPKQTHDREAREGALFGDELLPWVTMAEALGWGATERPYVTLAGGTGGGPSYDMTGGSGGRGLMLRERSEGRWIVNTGRDWKPGGSREDAQTFDAAEQPAPTVDGKGRWHAIRTNNFTAIERDADGGRSKAGSVPYEREVDRPAPTVTGAAGSWEWQDRWSGGVPARDPEWPLRRPATTLSGDPRVAQPGHKLEQASPDSPGRMAGAIRLGLHEASVLQSFPADYPWKGTKTKQFEQVGNAVPPALARAILATLVEAS